MPTANFYLGQNDGWVEIADAPDFVRTSGYPYSHPYYVYAGSSAPSLVAIAGTGTVTFAIGVPIDGETVTVGSEVYTFKDTAVDPFDVEIAATNILTAQNLKTVVNTDSTLVIASGASNIITLTAIAIGTQGNYALSEAATNVSVSGAALTGGTDVTVGVSIAHHPLKINVTMTEKLYARIISPVPNSNRADGKLRLDVLTIT